MSDGDTMFTCSRCFFVCSWPDLIGARSIDIGNACVMDACVRTTYVRDTYVGSACIGSEI